MHYTRIVVANFLILIALFAKGQSPNWQQHPKYAINVSLDTLQHRLSGNISIHYSNNSPDTLPYLWIHLWPNAYKNDRTAFAEQQLLLGKTAFYFAQTEKRGYINALHFTANGLPLVPIDHPQHIDIVQLMLSKPLLPGDSVTIQTPFNVQLPQLFSRMGYQGAYHAITQWFPKLAVYDEKGWHPMPYAEQGEFYADFADYTINITLPAHWVVAATGTLQNADERVWLQNLGVEKMKIISKLATIKRPIPTSKKYSSFKKPKRSPSLTATPIIATDSTRRKGTKTLHFEASNVVDFAWFTHPNFRVKYDTLTVDNRVIELWNYLLPADTALWKGSMAFTKMALKHYSYWLGAYPYQQVSVVADPASKHDGMEYPMVTNISASTMPELENTIVHEIGHNWLMGILANNERDYPWMDEGINSYLDRMYNRLNPLGIQPTLNSKQPIRKLKSDDSETLLDLVISNRLDQTISTPSAAFEASNYFLSSYTKTALWFEKLEQRIGLPAMLSLLNTYYKRYKFTHVYPSNFTEVVKEQLGHSGVQWLDSMLNHKGAVVPPNKLRSWKPVALFNLASGNQYRFLGIAPTFGWNEYDKSMLGIALHNYQLPASAVQWVVNPMLGTKSKLVNGYGYLSYTKYPTSSPWRLIEWSVDVAKFSTSSRLGQYGQALFGGYTRFSPSIYLEKRKKDPLATYSSWLQAKLFFISERNLGSFSPPPPGDTLFFATQLPAENTLISQLQIGWRNQSTLYPWSIKMGLQQVKDILRISTEANYFLNYDASGKGIAVKAFAGKIAYLQEKTIQRRIDNSRYHFTMYGANGQQDYTYSQPFAERNQSPNFSGREIMIRDGGFKYRSDYSSVKPGLNPSGLDFFDNWLAAVNFTIDIPDKINPLAALPFEVPLKFFADIGTSSSPWRSNSKQQRFLYSVGIQLPVLRFIHFYYPIFQSKVFEEPNSVNAPNRTGGALWWQKRLTFSLDMQVLKPKWAGVSFVR